MQEEEYFADAAEEQRLREALKSYADSVRAAAERPEGFWVWQRGAIAGRLAGHTPRARRLSWAAAMVVITLLAGNALRQTPADTTANRYDPDHELLVDVERSMRSEVPAALAPAALLAAEMSRAAEAEMSSPKDGKERS